MTGKFDGAKTFDQPAKYLFSSMGKAKVRLVAHVIKKHGRKLHRWGQCYKYFFVSKSFHNKLERLYLSYLRVEHLKGASLG